MSMFGKTNIWGKPNGYREPDWVVRQRRDARESERIRKQLERERKADERKRKTAEREREKAMRAASRTASSRSTRNSYSYNQYSGTSSHSGMQTSYGSNTNSSTYSGQSSTHDSNTSNIVNANQSAPNQVHKPTKWEYVGGVVILIIGIAITIYAFVDMMIWDGGYIKTWLLAVVGIFTGIYGLARLGK